MNTLVYISVILALFQSVLAKLVQKLTEETFDDFIKTNNLTMVEFYAPWCGHCKNFEPEYNNLAELLKSEDHIKIAKVDGSKEMVLASKYDVRGFPTLILFYNTKQIHYEGPRNAEKIADFIKSYAGSPVTIINSTDDAIKDSYNPSHFIGTFTSKKSEAFNTYLKTAETRRAYNKFYAIINPEAKQEEVHAYQVNEGARKSIPVTTQDALNKYIDQNRLPYFGEITATNFAEYDRSKKPLTWFIGTEEDYKNVYNVMLEVVKETEDHTIIVWLNTKENFQYAKSVLGASNLPAFVHTNSNNERFMYPGSNFKDSAQIIKFVNSAVKGELKKHYRSEEAPEKNDDLVKIIVGKTFETIFSQNSDVFLEIYAPWCTHCKKLEPIYADFAREQENNKHLMIAKIDGSANDIPDPRYEIKGFPTIFFIKAGTTDPITFEGDRTLEGLIEFYNKHKSRFEDVLSDEL